MNVRWVMGLVMASALPAGGQIMGLPVAGGAAAMPAGDWPVSGGGVFNGEVNLYGARMACALRGGWMVFGDVGVMDLEGMDSGFGTQGGVVYTLPFRWPVDVALQATTGWGGADSGHGKEVALTTVNGGILISKLQENFLTPYGFIGANRLDSEVRPGRGASAVRTDMMDLMLAGGIAATPGDVLTVYLEAVYLDTTEWIEDVFFSAGVRWVF